MVHAEASALDADNVIFEILTSVADIEGVDPLDLTPPLYEVIDPGSLGQIVATTPAAGRDHVHVTFSYNGHQITVGGDGSVSVEE